MEQKLKELEKALDFSLEVSSEETYETLKKSLEKKLGELSYFRQTQKKLEKERLLKETDYKHPTFAFDDDEVAVEGSCVLSSEEQAKSLEKHMNTDWVTQHTVKYTGPGKYRLIPSQTYDRCGDTVLTVEYVKGEDNV